MIVGALAPYDSWSRIQAAIDSDPPAAALRKKALNVEGSTKRDNQQDTYILLHGVLYYRSRGTLRVYVPVSLRKHLMYEYHNIEIAGHLGWRKALYALSQHYFWPNMSETVRAYVTQCCPTCQRTKATKVQPPALKPLASPVRPFHEITLDWVSGLPKDANGNDSMLNIVDIVQRFSCLLYTSPSPRD